LISDRGGREEGKAKRTPSLNLEDGQGLKDQVRASKGGKKKGEFFFWSSEKRRKAPVAKNTKPKRFYPPGKHETIFFLYSLKGRKRRRKGLGDF